MINFNPPIVDTRIIEHFLSDEEVSLILEETSKHEACAISENYSENSLECRIIPISNHLLTKKSNDLLKEKMLKEFGTICNVSTIHVLESYQPYRTHTDGITGEYGIDNYNYGSWTCVIPLETANTHTIIFNEWFVKSKNIDDYIAMSNPIDKIDDETYNKYLTYELREKMRYLSIETIFPWKKGSLLAASRYKWHCSDNYLKNNISCKKAIIMWCSMPYDV